MINVIKTPKSSYMNFFVFEADNKKTARVTKVTPDTEKDKNEEDPMDTLSRLSGDNDGGDVDVDTEKDDHDYTAGHDDNEPEDNTEGSDEDEEDPMDTLDKLGDQDGSDYDGSDTDSGEDGDNTDASAPADQAQTEEAFRRYSLYRDFVSLYNSVNSYINKLESILKDNIEANLVLKTVTSKLRDVSDLLYDYMTIKFQSATYLQSLVFFESTVAIIGLNFKMLKNNQIYLKQ